MADAEEGLQAAAGLWHSTGEEKGWGWDIFNQSVAYDFRRICVWPSGWRHHIAWYVYVYCICSSPKSGGHRSSGHHNQSISTPTPTSLLFPVHHTHPPKRHLGEVEIWEEFLEIRPLPLPVPVAPLGSP